MADRSTNNFSSLPEAVEPNYYGPKASDKQLAVGTGLEAFSPYVHKEVISGHDVEVPQPLSDIYTAEKTQQGRIVKRWSRKAVIWPCAIVLILIALGIGLGVGLSLSNDKTDNTTGNHTNSSSDTSPANLKGVQPRSGMSTCSIRWKSNVSWPSSLRANQTSLFLFYQHQSGDIRFMYSLPPGEWSGGTPDHVAANDAKNGTPVAVRCVNAGQFANGGLSLFYINTNNTLRQRIFDNTLVWSDGPLNEMDVKVWDSENVGLSANFFAGPINGVDLTGLSTDSGIRVWVAVDSTTFNQYSWVPGLTNWTYEKNWPGLNGVAAPTSFAKGAGHTSYVMFVDGQDNVAMYWIDQSQGQSTENHQLNVWTKALISIPNIDPTAGLIYRGNLFGRIAESGIIQGWNTTFAAENTTTSSTALLPPLSDPPGIPGSRLALTTYPVARDYDYIIAFYQIQGNDIVMCTGTVATGMWNNTKVPVPDD